jgi:hypothetical protein
MAEDDSPSRQHWLNLCRGELLEGGCRLHRILWRGLVQGAVVDATVHLYHLLRHVGAAANAHQELQRLPIADAHMIHRPADGLADDRGYLMEAVGARAERLMHDLAPDVSALAGDGDARKDSLFESVARDGEW